MKTGQQAGLRSLKHQVRVNDVVVYQADKSGRFSVDTPENYRSSVQPHIGDDPEISRSDHDFIEKILNAYGIAWMRFLSAGIFTRSGI